MLWIYVAIIEHYCEKNSNVQGTLYHGQKKSQRTFYQDVGGYTEESSATKVRIV